MKTNKYTINWVVEKLRNFDVVKIAVMMYNIDNFPMSLDKVRVDGFLTDIDPETKFCAWVDKDGDPMPIKHIDSIEIIE